MRVLFFLLILSYGISGYGFPENVRHGYFSCTTCHVAPAGGGMLTLYGRALSAELMSTWGSTKTSGFLFSDNENESMNSPWFRSQVFLRSVQTRRDSPQKETAQFIPMQADLEVGIEQEKYAVMVTAGARAKAGGNTALSELFSRRHYLLLKPDEHWNFRVGKFLMSFGLNGPDHITATRRGLGWDQGSESYNLEATYLAEKSSTTISAVSETPSDRNIKRDSGLAINQSFFAFGDSRFGISAYAGQQAAFKRFVIGPYMTLAITKEVFLDSEIFSQVKRQELTATEENGYATFSRLGWEVKKGIIPFVQIDRAFLNDSNSNSKFDSYGYGLQWLPYSHLETVAFVGKEKVALSEPTEFWWITFNLYL